MFTSIIRRIREWNYRRKYFDKKRNVWTRTSYFLTDI